MANKYKEIKGGKFVKMSQKEVDNLEASDSIYRYKMFRGRTVKLSQREIADHEASDRKANEVKPLQDAQAEIQQLEALKTPRRLTDAILTQGGKKWLVENEALIEAQREIIRNAT